MKKPNDQIVSHDRELFFSTFRRNIDHKSNNDNGWRSAIRNEWQFYDLIQKVWEKPFQSQLEKHVALQACSILLGDTDYLKRWPMKPWRQSEGLDYDTKKDRFPVHSPTLWLSDLGQIVKILSPILHNIFIERFSTQMMCNKFGLSKAQLIEQCQPIDFDNPMIQKSLFYNRAEYLKGKNYSFVSFRGLEEKICFDFVNRTFYFDEPYFLNKPISYFFHRINLMIKANEQKEFVFLHLDPMNEFFPIIRTIASSLQNQTESEVTKLLSEFEKERLQQLDIGRIKVQDVCRLWTEVWDELYKEQLAESLDLVGLVESYLNIDFFDTDSLLPLNLVHKNRRVRLLLNFATILKY